MSVSMTWFKSLLDFNKSNTLVVPAVKASLAP